jgi:5-formyltetrahydrofolate cyclo-ligase
MTKNEKKIQFRKESIKTLKKASTQNNYHKDKKVIDALYKEIQREKSKVIMLYLPLKMEVNLYPLISRLRREKKSLFVPFMEGESFRLVKYRLPLQIKRFGIKEPKYSRQYKARMIDMAIVPIVGIDSTQRRIGFGKGMYDRFFEKNIKNIKQTVFLTRILCQSNEVITESYDVQADKIITP